MLPFFTLKVNNLSTSFNCLFSNNKSPSCISGTFALISFLTSRGEKVGDTSSDIEVVGVTLTVTVIAEIIYKSDIYKNVNIQQNKLKSRNRQ